MATAKTTINSSNLYIRSPGKARATIPGHGTRARVSNPGRGIRRASIAGGFLPEGNPTSQVRGSKINRYSSKSLYKTANIRKVWPEIGSACSFTDFESFKDRFSVCNHAGALAGRLKYFLPNWQQITLDPVILDTVQGYKLELTSPLIQNRAPPRFSHTESEKIDIEITALLNKGALNKVEPVSGQFRSNIFLVPKRDGKSRPVINLKDLNAFIQYDHFIMEGTHLLRDLLQPHDWLGKIDLKGAYFIIPIWKEQRKYLRFVWKSTLPEFAFLPFGLATAPRLFTKVMKPIVALLRQVGIRLIIYLDDLLFMNQSKEGLLLDLTTARYLLENLRFVINLEKSCFTPTQTVDNTRNMILLLADYKVDAIKVDCYNLRCESESYLR